MRKWIVLFIILVIGLMAYNYVFHDHRDIESEPAEFLVNSSDLANEFAINPSASEQKYLNKTIEVQGTITEQNDFDLTLDDTIFCQFTAEITAILPNSVRVKGRFIGYDSLLEQVKLDQCSIITK